MKPARQSTTESIRLYRRRFLQMLGAFGLGASATRASAHHTDTHFDDASPHKLVYQLNKAEPDYIEAILFSCGEMLRKYGDDIEIVVSTIGPGLHLLGKRPRRYIKDVHQQRVTSLASYGVVFQACGNTMKSLEWTEKDLLEIAQVVPIGIDGIMQLQEKGFSYISW